MPYSVLQTAPGGRRRRRRRRWPPLVALAVVIAALVLVLAPRTGEHRHGPPHAAEPPVPGVVLDSGTAPLAGGGTAPSPLAVQLDGPADPVQLRFHHPPRSGLMFDVDTGRVLWRRDPTRILPIASLTKMMTALVAVDRIPAGGKVRVTKQALAYQGSGVGLLPLGKSIAVRTMLYGLLLPSGNDAAIAIAQRAAGTVRAFVAAMNQRAHAMGLLCTQFSSPSGFSDQGNHSCATDLAAVARAVLRQPRLATIVRSRQAVLPFPIKGGKIYLNNNNPLLRLRYPGTTGVKTGYTDAAGRCLVATARRRGHRLGVVLLNSPDTGTQATKLLDRGFALVAREG
jgi:serine-type D-Ala-D-Ala carboxypeptidase (penicillin-binding protein 5/6)